MDLFSSGLLGGSQARLDIPANGHLIFTFFLDSVMSVK